jgi:Arc/MetJ-type ribon-helix-helix transcriptional regulator
MITRKEITMTGQDEFKGSSILDHVTKALNKVGIDLETACNIESQGGKIKCVVVAPSLGKSVEELGESHRDQVVMVRVDSPTIKTLDAWVATGAVKSRSEAAALFIREGLKVRASELERLRGALNEVDAAKERLHRKAREVFGEGAEPNRGRARDDRAEGAGAEGAAADPT